jgi:hypothetical protein
MNLNELKEQEDIKKARQLAYDNYVSLSNDGLYKQSMVFFVSYCELVKKYDDVSAEI